MKSITFQTYTTKITKKIVAAFREMCKMYIQHRVHVLLIAIFKSTSECSADPGMLS